MIFIAITNVDYISLKLLYDAVVFTSPIDKRNARRMTVRECIEVWCSALHFNSAHCSALHFNSAHCSSVHFNSAHFSSAHFNSAHCSSVHFIMLRLIYSNKMQHDSLALPHNPSNS
jgi:hypothetical protein